MSGVELRINVESILNFDYLISSILETLKCL
jgi:hypothetical protein